MLIQVETVESFSELWHERASEADILHTLCSASEFKNMKVRLIQTSTILLYYTTRGPTRPKHSHPHEYLYVGRGEEMGVAT